MIILIALLSAGALLIMAEIFLPGMIAGILGGLCLAGAIVWSWNEFGPSAAVTTLVGELVGGLVLFLLWMKYFPGSPFGKRFSLPETPKQSSIPDQHEWIGKQGTAISPLRPVGTAKIDGKRVDVVTEGLHIDSGQHITVVKVEGTRIVVRKVSPSNTQTTQSPIPSSPNQP